MRLVKIVCFLTVFCKEFAEKRSVTRLRTDHLLKLCYFFVFSPTPFSLTIAMQILNIDYVPSFENELNIPYLVFIRFSFSRNGCASMIKKTILDTA